MAICPPRENHEIRAQQLWAMASYADSVPDSMKKFASPTGEEKLPKQNLAFKILRALQRCLASCQL